MINLIKPNIGLWILLQPLRWRCVDCVIHHERDVREEQHHTYMWHQQAIIVWSWHAISIVACCHSVKLCTHAARDFRSQQYHQNPRKLSNCLKFYWLKVIYICQSNKLEREIKHKTTSGSQKSGGGHGPRRFPLRTVTACGSSFFKPYLLPLLTWQQRTTRVQ